jgi:hypothetical protein
MILYELRCTSDHRFEGWFRNSDAFETQQLAHEIACPVCGDKQVDRALMAPAVGRKGNSLPDRAQAITLLRTLRKLVEDSHENVGDRFAEEARKIHYGETEQRGIYGEATDEEAEELADEGIEVGKLPWVPLADS